MVGFSVFCQIQLYSTLGILYLGSRDRHIYTVSVPNIYRRIGKEGAETLKEEVGCEWAQAWEEAMQARRDAEVAHAAATKASTRQRY